MLITNFMLALITDDVFMHLDQVESVTDCDHDSAGRARAAACWAG